MGDALPHAEVVRFLNRVARLKGYTASFLGLGSLFLSWSVLFLPVGTPVPPLREWGPRTVLSLAMQLVLVTVVAKWFARIPKGRAVHSTIDDDFLDRCAGEFGVVRPRLVITAITSSDKVPLVYLGGWGDEVAIVANSSAESRWMESPVHRTVEIAHELGHLWSHDLHLYYRVRAVGTVSLVVLLALLIGESVTQSWQATFGAVLAKLVLVGILVFVGMRSYIRFREHVADVSALFFLDDYAAIHGVLAKLAEHSGLGRYIGTHPSKSRRQAVLFNPFRLVEVDLGTYLLLGVSAGFLAGAAETLARPFLAGTRLGLDPFWIGAGVTALLLATVLARCLVEQFVFLTAPFRRTVGILWIMFAGAVLGLSVLDPFLMPDRLHATVAEVALIVVVTFGLAMILTIVCVAIVGTSDDGDIKTAWAFVLPVLLFCGSLTAFVVTDILFLP